MGNGAEMDQLVLKRAAWSEDDYDVLADGVVVGRIFNAAAAPVGTPWLWTLAYGHHEDRTPIYGYEPTREAAMAAFASCALASRTEKRAGRVPNRFPKHAYSQRKTAVTPLKKRHFFAGA